MKNPTALTTTSLLSAFLFAAHWADEISRGIEPGTLNAFGGIVILVVIASGPLVFGGRRTGYIISLIAGIFGLAVLVLHMSGHGMVGGRIQPNSNGAYFWIITLIMLGVTSTITAILAGQALFTRTSRS